MIENNVLEELACRLARQESNESGDEEGLVQAFTQVCLFLSEFSELLSIKGKGKSSLDSEEGIRKLVQKYFKAYRRKEIPSVSRTIPDEMVSLILMKSFGYSEKDVERIKMEHQRSMTAENCVGNLLERYLDSVLRRDGWSWCCGSFVKAIDFVKRDPNQNFGWLALQVKNRDNSENSSSRAIREGKPIEIHKWFRTYSKNGKKNWDRLPTSIQHLGLSEEGFKEYVNQYFDENRLKQKENSPKNIQE